MLRLEIFLATDDLSAWNRSCIHLLNLACSFLHSSSRSVPKFDNVSESEKSRKRLKEGDFTFFFSLGIDSSLSEIGLNIASRWE